MKVDVLILKAVLYTWPVIPIFWFPTHVLSLFSKRSFGPLPYIIAALSYIPVALFVHGNMDVFLEMGVKLPWSIRILGWSLLLIGLILHAWTILLLRLKIIGLPEVRGDQGVEVVRSGPFKYSRHPTYVAHHLIFIGAWLITGFHVLLGVAILDIIITQSLIIPLEERELKRRLGKAYEEYRRYTPRIFGLPRGGE